MPIIETYKGITVNRLPDRETYQRLLEAGEIKQGDFNIVDKDETDILLTDETLKMSKDGVLGVNTTNDINKDNTLPITSGAVFAEIGNIGALLETI